jgi:Tol biopolymer transport system component
MRRGLGAILAVAIAVAMLLLTGSAVATTRSSGIRIVQTGPAAWSPDGRGIVFGRYVNGVSQLVVTDASGRDLKVVWERRKGNKRWDATVPWSVSYSPDGRRFGLVGNFRLVIADRSGHTLDEWFNVYDFSWAPDGLRLATYTSDLGGSLVILKVNARARRLTRGPDVAPAWSPDGKWIAFAHDLATTGGMPDPGPYDLYAIRPNGRGLKRLARNAGEPMWSPRGDRLAFWRSRAYEIWSVRRNATLGRLLQRVPTWGVEPARWSADGRRLFAIRRGSATAGILTKRLAYAMRFSPDGKRILFLGGGGCTKSGIWVLAVASHQLKRVSEQCT